MFEGADPIRRVEPGVADDGLVFDPETARPGHAMQRSEAITRLTETAAHLQEAGILALYLFGSVARDEAGLDSDVDVFVDPEYARFGFVELLRTEAYLAGVLGCRVDLTTREGLHPYLRSEIEREAIRVL